jgi:DNA-binding NarL/FixJ family response regulator
LQQVYFGSEIIGKMAQLRITVHWMVRKSSVLTLIFFVLKINAIQAVTASKPSSSKRPRTGANPSLSAREREILNLLAHGLSNKEIGGRLDLSPFTVKNHLARIYPKLRVRSRTGAVIAHLRA